MDNLDLDVAFTPRETKRILHLVTRLRTAEEERVRLDNKELQTDADRQRLRDLTYEQFSIIFELTNGVSRERYEELKNATVS